MGQCRDPDLRPEPETEGVRDPDTDARRAKTGLESDDDDVGELTETIFFTTCDRPLCLISTRRRLGSGRW